VVPQNSNYGKTGKKTEEKKEIPTPNIISHVEKSTKRGKLTGHESYAGNSKNCGRGGGERRGARASFCSPSRPPELQHVQPARLQQSTRFSSGQKVRDPLGKKGGNKQAKEKNNNRR